MRADQRSTQRAVRWRGDMGRSEAAGRIVNKVRELTFYRAMYRGLAALVTSISPKEPLPAARQTGAWGPTPRWDDRLQPRIISTSPPTRRPICKDTVADMLPRLICRASVLRTLRASASRRALPQRRALIAAPKPGDGPLMERRADRELPGELSHPVCPHGPPSPVRG